MGFLLALFLVVIFLMPQALKDVCFRCMPAALGNAIRKHSVLILFTFQALYQLFRFVGLVLLTTLPCDEYKFDDDAHAAPAIYLLQIAMMLRRGLDQVW